MTLEYPYSECTNVASVYRHVSQGLKPEALAKVKSPELFEFICCCLEYDVEKRFTAAALLQHPWLQKNLKALEDDENNTGGAGNQFIELVSAEQFEKIRAQIGGTADGWAKYCDSICIPLYVSFSFDVIILVSHQATQ